MLAAEAAFEALLKGDNSEQVLSVYKQKVDRVGFEGNGNFSKNFPLTLPTRDWL